MKCNTKKYVWICVIALCMMLNGCGSKETIELNGEISKHVQNDFDEKTTSENGTSAESTIEPEKVVVEKWKDDGISCRVEEDTLVFSGKGCLLESEVEQLIAEIGRESNLVKVVIEDGITAIGVNAFAGMSKLETLVISGSVDRIGEYAFEGCENLKTVLLGEGISDIAGGAFAECESLSELEIPESVEIIGSNAFVYTPWLEIKKLENQIVVVNGVLIDATQVRTDFEVPENISYTTATAFENTGWLERRREAESFVIINGILIDGKNASGDVVIPEGVKCIADSAFACCDKITSVSLPVGLERIESMAFQGCSNLLAINIPDSVKYLGAAAFAECSHLGSIKLPHGINGIETYAFRGCVGLKKVELPKTIEYIGEEAFYGCSTLEKLELSERIKVIGDYAFSNCRSISKAMLPDTIMKIGNGIFDSCSNLASVELPKGIISIGDYAFCRCENLEEVKLPNTIQNIGTYAFAETSLKRVQIPDNVQRLADKTFWHCVCLENVIIPDTVTSIGDCVFEGTPWLEKQENELLVVNNLLLYASISESKISIPEGVVAICGGAFKNNQMVEGEIPNSVQNIGSSAFEGCINLRSVSLPDSITMIREKSFCDCTSLEEIDLPKRLVIIEQEAFRNCCSLTHIEIPESIVDLGSEAFKGCSSLTTVNLPKGLTTIEYGMFSGCNNITSIVIPQGVSFVGPYSFSDCSRLTSVAIPKSVEEIWESSFERCYMLTLYCDKGAYAERYAIENEIRCLTLEEEFWVNGANLPTERPSLKRIVENDADGLIVVNGEKCHVVLGQDKALVWKYVEATFDERAYFASAIAEDMSQIAASDSSSYAWDAFRYTNWHKWYGWEEFQICHIGDDMFLFEGYVYGEYFGYYIDGTWNDTIEVNSWLEDEEDSFERLTAFNDGYALGKYIDTYHGDSDCWLALLDKQGNMEVSEIELSYRERDLGLYSDGVFYYNYAFYDINFNIVLELSEKDWGGIYVKQDIYAPYFQDGICRLITQKNGKYWIFDIDRSGQIVSEIEEFDVLALSY